MEELNSKQEDFVLEQGMEDYYDKKIKEEEELFECQWCHKEFVENDLDRKDGEWICRDCEEEIDKLETDAQIGGEYWEKGI